MVAVGVQTRVLVHSVRYTTALYILWLILMCRCQHQHIAWVTARRWQSCQSAPLSVCQSSTTTAATSVILLLVLILLMLLNVVNVWKVFFLTSWQHGHIALQNGSAWPSYSALLPTWNTLGGSCVRQVIHYNSVTSMQSWGRHAACTLPVCNQPASSSIDFRRRTATLAFYNCYFCAVRSFHGCL